MLYEAWNEPPSFVEEIGLAIMAFLFALLMLSKGMLPLLREFFVLGRPAVLI